MDSEAGHMRGLALLRPERQPQTHGGRESLQTRLRAPRARDTSLPHQGQGCTLSSEGWGTTRDRGARCPLRAQGPQASAEREMQAGPGWEQCVCMGHALGVHGDRMKEQGVTPRVPTGVVSEKT